MRDLLQYVSGVIHLYIFSTIVTDFNVKCYFINLNLLFSSCIL